MSNLRAFSVLTGVVGSLAALAGGHIVAGSNPRSDAQQSKPTIEVSEASYGLNCKNDQAGNATEYVKDACNGKSTCSFPVSQAARRIGDHCPGVPKDFDYAYLCGDKEKKGHINGEANGKTARLSCAD